MGNLGEMLEQPEAINATTQPVMAIVTAEKFYGLANQQGSRHSVPEPSTTMAQASRVKWPEAPSSLITRDEDIVFSLLKNKAVQMDGVVVTSLLEKNVSMQPVEGDTPLTGKEEDLKFYSDDVLINQMRGGVSLN